jgi:hypothetical protein
MSLCDLLSWLSGCTPRGIMSSSDKWYLYIAGISVNKLGPADSLRLSFLFLALVEHLKLLS